jgi:hypothetical protein
MFGRVSKGERALYERIIVILADQIDWHRNAAGLPMLGVPTAGRPALDHLTNRPEPEFLNEDEEIVRWQAQNQVLDLDDARAALAQIGAMNTEVSDYS